MDNDAQTPAITTWLLAAVPISCVIAYYHPLAEFPAGLIIIGGGSIAVYRIRRWAMTRAGMLKGGRA